MGQTIEILSTTAVGNTLLINSDRSLAGQDGVAFVSAIGAGRATGAPAMLATRLFEADPEVDHVFVMSNSVSVGRRKAWSEEAIEKARSVVSGLFSFYG